MTDGGKKILDTLAPRRILLPVLIGLGVLGYLFYRNFDIEAFEGIRWTWNTTFWLLMALVFMGIRQFAYMYRLRILTDKKLTWRSSFEVVMLWEFGSAATPSSVGGTAVALFLLTKENIRPGKTGAIVLFTIFLDMLFLIGALLICILLLTLDAIFPEGSAAILFNYFLITMAVTVVYTSFVIYGLFINPRGLKWIMVKFMSIKFLRKWRYKAIATGNELVQASSEIKTKSIKFWTQAVVSTVATWSARFLVVNCVVLMVTTLDEHFLMYARQLALTVMMMMSPTPGGSGVAELSFGAFIADLVPRGLIATIAFAWRLITYYPYLFIGIIILPVWVKRVFSKKHEES